MLEGISDRTGRRRDSKHSQMPAYFTAWVLLPFLWRDGPGPGWWCANMKSPCHVLCDNGGRSQLDWLQLSPHCAHGALCTIWDYYVGMHTMFINVYYKIRMSKHVWKLIFRVSGTCLIAGLYYHWLDIIQRVLEREVMTWPLLGNDNMIKRKEECSLNVWEPWEDCLEGTSVPGHKWQSRPHTGPGMSPRVLSLMKGEERTETLNDVKRSLLGATHEEKPGKETASGRHKQQPEGPEDSHWVLSTGLRDKY